MGPAQTISSLLRSAEQIDQFLAEINFSCLECRTGSRSSVRRKHRRTIGRFPQYTHLIRAYYDHFEDSIVGPISEPLKFSIQLKQAGYPLYGLSNWSAETYPRIQHQYDFFNLFDKIILSGEVKLIKPDPAIFKLTLKNINRPARRMFVD